MVRPVFVYCHDWSNPTTSVSYCMDRIERTFGARNITRLTTPDALACLTQNGISIGTELLRQKKYALFTDILRFCVLVPQGGVWLDVTTIVREDLAEWTWQHVHTHGLVAFHNPRLGLVHGMESNFLATRPHHPFVVAVRDELVRIQQALRTTWGRASYALKSGILSRELHPVYHTIYMVMEVVLRAMSPGTVHMVDATSPEGNLHYMHTNLAGPLDWLRPSLFSRTRGIQTSINTGTGHHLITKLTANSRDTLYFPQPCPRALAPSRVWMACISLASSQDRYERVRTSLGIREGDGGNGSIYFHRPVRDKRGGRAGCFQSHLDVFRICMQRGFRTAIVFEDDLVLSNQIGIQDVLGRIQQIERHYPDWRRISLHGSGIGTTTGPSPVPGLIHANSGYIRCYAISYLGMQEMLRDGLTKDQHVDVCMLRRFVSCPTFAAVPFIENSTKSYQIRHPYTTNVSN